MKIIVIGDLHGLDIWKKILEKESNYDLVIFLGDYLDSFDIPFEQQVKNYIEIRKLRDTDNRIITLLGNHEFHYIYNTRYSGWRYQTDLLAKPLLITDFREGKLKYAYLHDKFLFSHAGVTNFWLNNVAKANLKDLLSNQIELKHFNWNSIKGYDAYGDTISNSPIWVRPKSLLKDCLDKYVHVVGHTYTQLISVEPPVIQCDTLSGHNTSKSHYLIIIDGIPEFKTIE